VIKQTMRAGNIVETQKAAILAALSITDELFDAREAGEDLARSMKRLSGEVRPWLPPAKRKDA
jgi:cell division protein ZapA